MGSDPQSHLQVMHEDLHAPCRKFAEFVAGQLRAWDELYPDRKDDSPQNRAVREALKEFQQALK